VTPLVRGHVRKGTAEPIRGALPRWLAAFPHALVPRALALGLVGVALSAAFLLALSRLLGLDALGFGAFLGFKAGWAGLLGALVTPAIALLALADRRA
jgi:hypothetical protein